MKKTENQNNLQFQKNFIWNLLGTTVNALTSFLYMIIVTRLNGLSDAGMFSFAFSNASVLVVLGMYMGRAYQVSNNRFPDGVFIQSRKITCFSMLVIAVIMLAVNRYPFERAAVFLAWIVYKMLDAFSDVIYGVLHKNDRLDYVGQSLTIKALLSVVSFAVLDCFFKDIMLASIGACIAMLVVMIFWDYPHYRIYHTGNLQWNMKDCITVLKEGAFICATTFLSTYLVNASKYAIDAYGSDSEQAVYGILVMPATAMILVGQYLIQPLLLKISFLYQQRQTKILIKTLYMIIGALAGVGIFGIICAATIGIPLLNIVYGVDLSAYRTDLIIVIAGAIAYGCTTVLTNVLTVMNKNKIQTLCFTVITIAVFEISGMSVQTGGIRGAVFVYMGSMFAAFISLACVTARNIQKEN